MSDLTYYDRIVSYLENDMPEQEQQFFEQELHINAKLKEEYDTYLATLKIIDELAYEKLREKTAAIGKKTTKQNDLKTLKGRIILIILVVVIGGLLFWLVQGEKEPILPVTPNESPGISTPVEESFPPDSNEAPEAEEDAIKDFENVDKPERPIAKEETTSEQIIAQNEVPDQITTIVPKVLLRSGNSELTPEEQALIDSVWYMSLEKEGALFTPTFRTSATMLSQEKYQSALTLLAKLEQDHSRNDTLVYLKGLAHLGFGEGRQAGRYFIRLNRPGKPWRAEAQWYLGLGYLLMEENEKALDLWKKILDQPNHQFWMQAKNGVEKVSNITN